MLNVLIIDEKEGVVVDHINHLQDHNYILYCLLNQEGRIFS